MVLAGRYPPDPRVRKEAKALLEVVDEVRLLCRGEDSTDGGLDGLSVRGIPDEAFGGPRALARGLRNYVTGVHPTWSRALAEELARGADVVHVHDLPKAPTALRVADDVPVVVDLHENYPAAIRQYRRDWTVGEVATDPWLLANGLLRPVWRWDRRLERVLRDADHVLATTPEARSAYVGSAADPDDVTVVSNTVDRAWFDANRDAHPVTAPDGFTLTYVGTLSGVHRGLDTVVRAMPRLRERVPDARFRVVGGGPMAADLRELAADLGVADAVEFTGWVDAETMPGHAAAADVGVVPHRSNPHTDTTVPHKLFHYMAAGLPVLATDTPPVARVVDDADAGRIVPPEDPAAMAEAAAALAERDDRAPLGSNGRAAVDARYNWERDGERLRDVYRRFDAAPTTRSVAVRQP